MKTKALPAPCATAPPATTPSPDPHREPYSPPETTHLMSGQVLLDAKHQVFPVIDQEAPNTGRIALYSFQLNGEIAASTRLQPWPMGAEMPWCACKAGRLHMDLSLLDIVDFVRQ
ncbi:uncharacterized protein BO72DRAFT_492835 [Aspergillus fijiensis CBS 313.89]|uniref:Uncharacterized protein n=1 Tax=Aspergillus fijiensis CBS 313.89 TaxID=1448319 RepID=A0A8G1RY31_9EURO|nr:uncharacterized protein BO72DRAFT_492835 [Aspergillus fijiensis CBS 313.89]RAK80847.1 hypothetical protein BO72DRAFT_492835 [Aspergillus fijiensis CBS 313.89]